MAQLRTQGIRLPRPALHLVLRHARLNTVGRKGFGRGLVRCKVSERPDSARDAVQGGLKVLQEKEVREALELFQLALQLNPDEEERRAAVYNSACCYAKLRRWKEAAAAVQAAVNENGLQLSVAEEVCDWN